MHHEGTGGEVQTAGSAGSSYAEGPQIPPPAQGEWNTTHIIWRYSTVNHVKDSRKRCVNINETNEEESQGGNMYFIPEWNFSYLVFEDEFLSTLGLTADVFWSLF